MKEKKSEAPRRGNEELFKWDGNPTFGQIQSGWKNICR